MNTNIVTPSAAHGRLPRAAAAFLLGLTACALAGGCGGERDEPTVTPDTPTAPERVDVERLEEDMRKRASEEINAENLDAELEKLESELSSDSE